jgi:hypothetical protein
MTHQLIGEARQGGFSVKSSGGVPTLVETYEFRVKADSINASRLSVSFTPGLPIVNQTVSAFGLTVCRSKQGDRDPLNPLYWDFVCEFSSEVEENQDRGGADEFGSDPTEWTPIYETRFERMTEIVNVDASGDPITNSADEMFPEGMTRTRFIPIWTFFQFEAPTVTDETIIGRNEVVNSSTFKGRAAKTLLCTIVKSTIGFYYGQKLRFTQYELRYNVRTWQLKRLDMASDGTALNGSGAAAAGAPAILTFDQFATDSFSFLRV